MTNTDKQPDDVIVIGGGFSGLSIAAVLAVNGIPVTLLESSSAVGAAASTRNQGWLHSGAWFAVRQRELAVQCYRALRRVIRFCPDCLEPGHTGMLYLQPADHADAEQWQNAWDEASIPWKELSKDQLHQLIPEIDQGRVSRVYHLPDRAFRPSVLLGKLAELAMSHGARIHTGMHVTRLDMKQGRVVGVVTSRGRRFPASFVVLATNAAQADFSQFLGAGRPQEQSLYQRVTLQGHLIAVKPRISAQPFCIMDNDGLNHLPHTTKENEAVSVFGNNHWKTVTSLESHRPSRAEFDLLKKQVQTWLPQATWTEERQWSGTTVQAMHIEQINPGHVPLPTVIDHANEEPQVANMISVYPGRATLWPQLASDAAELVISRINPAAVTAAQPPWQAD